MESSSSAILRQLLNQRDDGARLDFARLDVARCPEQQLGDAKNTEALGCPMLAGILGCFAHINLDEVDVVQFATVHCLEPVWLEAPARLAPRRRGKKNKIRCGPRKVVKVLLCHHWLTNQSSAS